MLAAPVAELEVESRVHALENHTAESPKVHLWTRDEYYAMGDVGLFDGKRVELIEGEVIEMAPMRNPHRISIVLVDDILHQIFGAGWFIQTQLPLNLAQISEPEPDVAVIAGHVRDYKSHPTTAALVVEVSDTSLTYDRTTKASLYARAGIADYWIINLNERQLLVHRQPQADPTQQYGFGYAEIMTLNEADSVSPLAAPHARVAVADLLP